MNVDYSYVEVPTTTQEAMEKEDRDQPIQPSETHTLAAPDAPAAPEVTVPTLDRKSLIMPIGTLLLGAVLASGHHAFNVWEDVKPVAKGVILQHGVTLLGVVFAFGFTSAVGATMGFVRLQCLWLSVLRQPLTIQQINTIYQIERQEQLYRTLPRALFFSPTIVTFSALTLLLPISGVFPPGSLTVTTKNSTDVGPCTIPTGNISTPDTVDSESLYNLGAVWEGVTPRATALTVQCLAGQSIPDLPQACGPNCRYNVSVPSFVFQCTPNPSSLPYGQAGVGCEQCSGPLLTLWNGTTDPTSKWAFYLAWASNDGGNGTSGNASCSPVQAQYDVEVQTKGGVQSVTTSISQRTSDLIPDVNEPGQLYNQTITANMDNFYMQLASISYATQTLFLGNAVLEETVVFDYRTVGLPSFLDKHIGKDAHAPEYSWGDVLKGIEEISHNVTAALLTLSLGTMDANCSFDRQDLVYRYTPYALWVPYGTALGITLISLMVAIMMMARNNTGDITTSFWDTVILTRNMDEDVSSGAKLRLRAAEDGKLGYTLV